MEYRQISNYGTSNPIVARLSLQTQELLKFYHLTERQKQDVFGLMFSDIQPKLLTCFGIADKIAKQVAEEQQKIREGKVEVQGSAYRIPNIFNLRSDVETFLYQAKSVLRDLTRLFLILFSKDFGNQAHFDSVLAWSKEKFSEEHPLTAMLKTDQAWIKKIIRMRNAVEHPGGKSGTLNVLNFTSSKQANRIMVTEPLWGLNNDPPLSIATEMPVIVDNLLTFCEQVLILCLEEFKKNFPIVLVEVPESERDPICPIRYKMTVDTSKAEFPPRSPTDSSNQPNSFRKSPMVATGLRCIAGLNLASVAGQPVPASMV